jgi:hypothetical protein
LLRARRSVARARGGNLARSRRYPRAETVVWPRQEAWQSQKNFGNEKKKLRSVDEVHEARGHISKSHHLSFSLICLTFDSSSNKEEGSILEIETQIHLQLFSFPSIRTFQVARLRMNHVSSGEKGKKGIINK